MEVNLLYLIFGGKSTIILGGIMKNILEELFWLNIDIKARNKIVNSNVRQAEHTFGKYEEILLKRLKGRNLKVFKKMISASFNLAECTEKTGFTDGAKVGAKIMIEILASF